MLCIVLKAVPCRDGVWPGCGRGMGRVWMGYGGHGRGLQGPGADQAWMEHGWGTGRVAGGAELGKIAGIQQRWKSSTMNPAQYELRILFAVLQCPKTLDPNSYVITKNNLQVPDK